MRLFRTLDLPDPEHFGERYPHQVSGGQLQRAMTAMAHVLQARHHRVRRADHGARRHDPGRGAGRDQHAIREHGHGGALHHPRPRRGRPDRRPDHGAAPRQAWSSTAQTEQILQQPRDGLYPRAGQRAPGRRRGARRRPRPSQCSRSTGSARYAQSRDLLVLEDVIARRRRRARRSRWSANPAAASRTLARVITGLLPRAAGEILFEGKPLPPRAQAALARTSCAASR